MGRFEPSATPERTAVRKPAAPAADRLRRRSATPAPDASADPDARIRRAERLGHRVRGQDLAAGCGCPLCGGGTDRAAAVGQRQAAVRETVRRARVQRASLADAGMTGLASSLAGDSQSTVAVAKEAGGDYEVYSQSSLASKSDVIGGYDNVTLKWDTSPGKGYHAETMALMTNQSLSRVAASQPICLRCQAMLTDNGVTAVNPGAQFTKNWQAPFTEEIDEDKSFPAKAKDNQADGQSGTRWGMTGGNLYSIPKSTWGPKHGGGW